MSHSLELKIGALFIADAHYPNHGKEFLTLLQNIECGKINPPQLILMGDIFDLLVGSSKYLKEKFKTEIALINSIAKDIEVIYLEGNHDFKLKPLFNNVLTVPIQQQPLLMHHNTKTIALSHGDKYCMSLSYKIYTKIIRNTFVLQLIPNSYAKAKLQSIQKKKICKKIKAFPTLAKEIAKNYTTNLIIEGHYHQGITIDNYISLPSFACNGQIGIFNGCKVYFTDYSTVNNI